MNAYRQTKSNKKQRTTRGAAAIKTPSAFVPAEVLEARTLLAAAPLIAAPANVAVATVSEDSLNVTWSGNPVDATQIVVERCPAGGRFRPVASLPADANSFSDSELLPLTKYMYRVRANNGTAFSRPSRAGAGVTATWLSAAPVSSTSVKLEWTDHSIGERQFIIDRSAGPRGRYSRVATLPADTTEYTDSGLLASTAYNYRIRPLGGAPRLKPATAQSTTPAPSTDPGTGGGGGGGGSTSMDGFTAVDGSWALVNGTYQISTPGTAATSALNTRSIRDGALAGDFTLSVDAAVTPTSGNFDDFAVIFGYQDANDYYFFSSNEGNDGGTNGIFKVVNGVSTELADVTSTITAGTTYTIGVERQGDQIRAFRDGVLVASATDGTFTSGQIGFGTKYDQATFSNLTVTGSVAQPPTTAPAAPSGLSATAGSSTYVNLTWVDNSSNEGGFKIERSNNSGSTWTLAGTVAAGVTLYTATGLTASTAYMFRVRAFNVVGDSANSNTDSATTDAAPQLGDRPGASNTGPTNAGALQSVGSMTITQDGAVVENVFVHGTIDIQANNVTIRNFVIDASGNGFGITPAFGHSGQVIEDGEIYNANQDGVYGEGYTARRLNIHDTGGDGMKTQGNSLIEGCWVHHVGQAAGSHADGVQIMSGAHIIVQGNFFDMPFSDPTANSNSSIIIKTDFGDIDDVLFQNNWCNGGNFTVYVRSGSGGGVPTNIRILNNRFGHDYHYGPFSIEGNPLIQGNVWDDTGAPVTA